MFTAEPLIPTHTLIWVGGIVAGLLMVALLILGVKAGQALTGLVAKPLRSRRGISYPIVFTLVTVAAIAVALMMIGPMMQMGSQASRQAVLQVSGTSVIQDNGTKAYVYVTVRNIGTVPATVARIAYRGVEASVTVVTGGQPIQPNSEATLKASFASGTFPQVGQTYQLTLITDKGTLIFTAYRQT